MLVDELYKPLLAAAGHDHGAAVLDDARGKRFTDSTCRSDDEDFLIGKSHLGPRAKGQGILLNTKKVAETADLGGNRELGLMYAYR